MLSASTRTAWAKSAQDAESHRTLIGWLPLFQHLDDSLGIAEALWDHWLPRNVQQTLSAPFGSAGAGRAVLAFLAGVHDVGKASPAFAVQVPELAEPMRQEGLPFPSVLPGPEERSAARHEIVSYLALEEWLEHSADVPFPVARQLASVVGAHHGSAPNNARVGTARDRPDLTGEGAWTAAREELIERAASASGFARHREAVAAAKPPETALVLLAAIIILADWLASNERYFPLFPVGDTSSREQRSRVAEAWERAGFPARWEASPPSTVDTLFETRFGFGEPTDTQRTLVDLVSEPTAPRLVILEAAMGSGKTEAALAAAEILAQRTGAGGIFIGLPTQATTDSMFSRVLEWGRTLDAESSVFLAHGKSTLNPVFDRMERDAFFFDIGRERALERGDLSRIAASQNVLAHHWFADRKRGPLANLVIGTIDQALLLALRSKHLMLRHLALANKVVIIDEAHAFSSYMSRYLDRALEWLGGYGTPVIILSATLPANRRADMVGAYERGARLARGERTKRAVTAEENARVAPLRTETGYPLIVATDGIDPPRVMTPLGQGSSCSVSLEWVDDSAEALEALLREQLRDGGCAAVLHNTVARVQSTAASLRAAFPEIPVLVAHSRFLATDRIKRDTQLLDLLGSPRRSTGRPRTCIVVATQVIEQSLDIDFDFMVTDIAPVDLILQRSGRLHRHRRGVDQSERPAPLRQPQLVLTGVNHLVTPPEPDGGAVAIYGRHLLLRTLALLQGRAAITVPEDISPLVQAVYGDADLAPDGWAEALATARVEHEVALAQRRNEADAFRLAPITPGQPLVGWADRSVGAVDTETRARAAVREGEDSLEVLVLFEDAEGTRRTAPWAADGGAVVPLNEAPDRALQKRILGSSLRLPGSLSRPWNIDAHLSELERRFDLPHWHSAPLLRGELLLVFDEHLRTRLGRFELRYSRENGLDVASVELDQVSSK